MIFRSQLNKPPLVLCCAVALLSACGGMGMGMNQKSGNSNSRGLFVSDGGGKAAAATRPVLGADRIAKFVLGYAGKAHWSESDFQLVTISGKNDTVTCMIVQ